MDQYGSIWSNLDLQRMDEDGISLEKKDPCPERPTTTTTSTTTSTTFATQPTTPTTTTVQGIGVTCLMRSRKQRFAIDVLLCFCAVFFDLNVVCFWYERHHHHHHHHHHQGLTKRVFAHSGVGGWKSLGQKLSTALLRREEIIAASPFFPVRFDDAPLGFSRKRWGLGQPFYMSDERGWTKLTYANQKLDYSIKVCAGVWDMRSVKDEGWRVFWVQKKQVS